MKKQIITTLVVLLPIGSALAIQDEPKEPAASQTPFYPRVSVATWYRVDPSWPKTPEDFGQGHVPGIDIGPDGNIYVAVRADPPIRVYTPEGTLVRAFGSEEVDTAHHLKFDPEGKLWLSDIGHHVVMQFSTDGTLLRTLGTRGEPGCDETHFNMPTDVAVTPEGDIFVSDGYGNSRIVHFDKEGRYVNAWGELGVGPGQFSIPHAIAVDSKGRLYVADRNNVRIQIFDQDGTLLDIWNDLLVPWGFCVTPEDDIWVCGSSPMPWRLTDPALGCPPKDQVFMRFRPNGRLEQLWSVPKATDGHERSGECNWVHCITTDSEGNLYVGDIIGQRAQKFLRMSNGELRGPAILGARE